MRASPTRFSTDAFTPAGIAIAALIIIGISIVAIVAGAVGVAIMALTHGFSMTQLQAMRGHIPAWLIGPSFALQALLDIAIAIAVIAMLPWLSKSTLRDIGFRTPTAATVLIAIGGALAMFVVVDGLGTLTEFLTHSKHAQMAVQLITQVHDLPTKLMIALMTIVIAPFGEESAFRLFVFNAASRYANFWIAAAISGLLFGAAHADAYAFVPLVFGGMILCYVYYVTRNAYASMISHGLFNAVPTIALLFFPHAAILHQ